MDPGLDLKSSEDLRRDDPDRFWCLVATAPVSRPAISAVLAFNQELGRIAQQVSQPMAGFIRLQWWREAVDEARLSQPRRHPVAKSLPLILAAGIDKTELEGLIDARERELDDAPIADLTELVGHARGTAGALQAMIAAVSGDDRLRARKIGTGYGLLGILRATGHLSARAHCLFPADLLAKEGVRRDDVLAGHNSDGLARVVADVARAAEAEIAGLAPKKGEAATPLLLIVRHQLRQLARLRFDPFTAASITRPPFLAVRLMALQMFGR